MQVPQVDQAGKGDPAGTKARVPAGYIEFSLR
jgi:hypothetical protein